MRHYCYQRELVWKNIYVVNNTAGRETGTHVILGAVCAYIFLTIVVYNLPMSLVCSTYSMGLQLTALQVVLCSLRPHL